VNSIQDLFFLKDVNYIIIMKRYPLIVHLENHCSVPQQRLAARILRDSIGPALLRTSTDDDSKPLTLRSPEELVGKVIISVRKNSILSLRIDPDLLFF